MASNLHYINVNSYDGAAKVGGGALVKLDHVVMIGDLIPATAEASAHFTITWTVGTESVINFPADMPAARYEEEHIAAITAFFAANGKGEPYIESVFVQTADPQGHLQAIGTAVGRMVEFFKTYEHDAAAKPHELIEGYFNAQYPDDIAQDAYWRVVAADLKGEEDDPDNL